ncbi:MAG: hypothetical protein CTY35_03410 [Methylotenera sp.]|nr:MAG: hypothetical protein CTY35_03410 [Methylotenera sp.]
MAKAKVVPQPITIHPIKSWSYSRLLDFEMCNYRAQLKYVDRIPEEQGEAAERGTMIHQLAEDFVRGKIKKLPVELLKFSDEFLALRQRYLEKAVSLEGEWGFDKDWNVSGYKEAWVRIKLDARIQKSPKHSIVVDYKTGKRFGNEIKHGEQVVLYGLAELLRQPEVELVDVELWYLDVDVLISTQFTREQLMRFLPSFEKRGLKITTATTFPPNPNEFSCKWCPFSPNKGGQCQYGLAVGSSSNASISNYRKQFG